ncbi:MAG TPA: transposase [Chloroflexota bacterium]|nr:transposase [Chloroflexota bacterium]
MVPTPCETTAAVPPPSYQRALAKRGPALHLDALTLVRRLHLLALCRRAVTLAQRQCPPPLPKGPGGAPQTYSAESLLLIALVRTRWRLGYQEMHDWLVAWPARAVACGRPTAPDGQVRVPSPSQMCKRAARAGAPPCEMLFVLAGRAALRRGRIRARDLIIDSAPIKAWRRRDGDAQHGPAPAHHRTRFLHGYRVHTLLCRASGLPLFFRLAPANRHDAPFAQPLLATAAALYHLRPRLIRLDAAYWGLALIAWIHTTLGAVAVIPFTPKATKDRACLLPTWTADELGKRSTIERFFGRLFRVFPLQRPPLAGWSAVTCAVALSFTATLIVALAAQQAGRPDLIRSPRRVLAHLWEGVS